MKRQTYLHYSLLLIFSSVFGCSMKHRQDVADTRLSPEKAPTQSSVSPSFFQPHDDSSTHSSIAIQDYPTTGTAMFDPPTDYAPNASRDFQYASVVSYDQVHGVTVPQNMDSQRMIGSYRDGLGFKSLTLHASGSYEYVDCGLGCMYSYSGYQGIWEAQGNVIWLRQAQPTERYRSIYPAATASSTDPFLQLDALLLNDELVLVESDRKEDFMRNGVVGRACFKRQSAPPHTRLLFPETVERAMAGDGIYPPIRRSPSD